MLNIYILIHITYYFFLTSGHSESHAFYIFTWINRWLGESQTDAFSLWQRWLVFHQRSLICARELTSELKGLHLNSPSNLLLLFLFPCLHLDAQLAQPKHFQSFAMTFVPLADMDQHDPSRAAEISKIWNIPLSCLLWLFRIQGR